MKRIISGLISVIIAASSRAATASAVEAETSDNNYEAALEIQKAINPDFMEFSDS